MPHPLLNDCIKGSVKLKGSNAGLVFADGTKLTTASDGGLWQKIGTAGHIQYNNGNVGIGLTAAPAEKLHIKGNVKIEGKIAAVEICANPTSSWCDYVFEPDYQLPTLASVQTFLAKHKHLPDVPSAADVEANGYNMNKMDTALLKKLEEAYLYILDMEARLRKLEEKK